MSACISEIGDSRTRRPSHSASAASSSRDSASPMFCSAACSISPASLNTATVLTFVRKPAAANHSFHRSLSPSSGSRASASGCAPSSRRAAVGEPTTMTGRLFEHPLRLQARATARRPAARPREILRAAGRSREWTRRFRAAATDAARASDDPRQQPAVRKRRQHGDAQSLRLRRPRRRPRPGRRRRAAPAHSARCATAPAPAGLSTTRRPRRSNSAKPSCSSRPRICWLTALCVRFSVSAAARRFCTSATARNAVSVLSGRREPWLTRTLVSTAFQNGRNKSFPWRTLGV